MSRLEDAVQSAEFAITTELTPPKGLDCGELLAKAESLKPLVHAINLTDSHRARMTIEPRAVGHLLLERGIEPIVQMTARDRNRIAIQADLLGGAALGIENVVFMTGDSPQAGDHPDAKPVFDLNASQMLEVAAGLCQGRDMHGNELHGLPRLYLGAVTNPGAKNFQMEIENTRRKIDAGAKFLQTQALFDAATLERFLDALKPDGVAVLAGVIPLKSGKMAHWLNENVPGIVVPRALLHEMDVASAQGTQLEVGIDNTGRIIAKLRPLCSGVHLMALGWEQHVGRILQAGGIRNSAS